MLLSLPGRPSFRVASHTAWSGTRPDGWWKDRHGSMVKLVNMLERWVVSSGKQVTVVFQRPPSPPIGSTVIEVAYAPRPRRDSADQEIARRVAADTEPAAIRVVTSALWLAERMRVIGATVESSGPLRTLIEDV
jgi:hypothetical protein